KTSSSQSTRRRDVGESPDRPPSVASCLPCIEIADLVMEVDAWTGFSHEFVGIRTGWSLRTSLCDTLRAFAVHHRRAGRDCRYGVADSSVVGDPGESREGTRASERRTIVYTRREFGKMTLAALPLSLALGPIDSRVGGVRIGVQSYSFRTLPLDAAIKAMADIGIGECELFSGHVEPRPSSGGGGPRPKAGGTPAAKTEGAKAGERPARKGQGGLRDWRLTVSMGHFKDIRRKFDDAGIRLHAYNLSFNDGFSDEEIDRGFEMAKALGVEIITASSTLSAAKRVAPFADKHKMIVAMHGHDNVQDPNQFATPESFAQAMALSKNFWVNLDIGHFFAAGYDPVAYIQ